MIRVFVQAKYAMSKADINRVADELTAAANTGSAVIAPLGFEILAIMDDAEIVFIKPGAEIDEAETMKKARVCQTCGALVHIDKEKVYTAQEPVSLFEGLVAHNNAFDAIDCPVCGCQIRVAARMPKVRLNEKESEAAENE